MKCYNSRQSLHCLVTVMCVLWTVEKVTDSHYILVLFFLFLSFFPPLPPPSSSSPHPLYVSSIRLISVYLPSCLSVFVCLPSPPPPPSHHPPPPPPPPPRLYLCLPVCLSVSGLCLVIISRMRSPKNNSSYFVVVPSPLYVAVEKDLSLFPLSLSTPLSPPPPPTQNKN